MMWNTDRSTCFIFLIVQICSAQNVNAFHQTETKKISDVRPLDMFPSKAVLTPVWYLSSNGSDTSTCGRNVSNTCRTLDWLLGRFYQAPYTINQTLSLVTDTSLIINKDLVQKHYWMRWLNVVTFVDQLSNHNVTVEISKVTQLESKWELHGMNLIIKNSLLPKTGFYLSNHKGGISNLINVTMSTFGLLQAHTGFTIQISNCILKGGAWTSSTLINVVNSNINITASIFQDFKTYHGSAVLNASSSRVHLENCIFMANIGKHGVIQVGKQTDINIYNSVFENNGLLYFAESTVLVNSHSKAVLRNSQFFTNIASTGGCIRSNPGTYLDVENSTFSGNQGASGGAIYCEGALYNKNDTGTYENESLSSVDPQCFIKKSIFEGNNALQSGGNTYFNRTTVKITDCHFRESVSLLGGAIMVYNTNITIDNSIFNATVATFEGGAFDVVDNCHIMINNSVVLFQTALKGSIFQIQSEVTLLLNNVTVRNGNTGPSFFLDDGYSFGITDHCSVMVTNSYFEPIHSFPWVFYMDDNSNLTVTGSRFKTIGNSSSQIVSAAKSSRVNFTKCIFEQCAGFVMLENSNLFMNDSVLTKSQYVVSNALVSASGNSKIELDKTNVTDIIPNVDLPFIRSVSSNVSISRCLHSRNRLSRHIVATEYSLVRVSDSYFENNTFSFGILYSSLFYLESSQLSMDGTLFKNNYKYKDFGLYNVAIVDAYSSNVEIDSGAFITAFHLVVPNFIFHMRSASIAKDSKNYLQISNSVFKSKGGSLRIEDIADVNIQSSFFQIDPNTDFPLEGSGLQLSGLKNLRIAKSHFNSSKDAKTQVALKYQADDFQFLTSYSQFTFGNYSLKSNDKNFMKKAQDSGLITIPFEVRDKHKETAYSSIIPILCHESNGDDCFCHYNQKQKINIYNCSYQILTSLPETLLNHTDWLVMEHTPVNRIDGKSYIPDMIQFLDLKQSDVAVISGNFLEQVNQSQRLKWLDLRGNNLEVIPQTMEQLRKLEKIWLSGNPIHCDCKMTWMIGWLYNSTTLSGEHVIVDYQDVKCSSGKMKGLPIYVLTEVLMGCYPAKLTLGQKLGIGIGAFVGFLMLILVFLVARDPREVKFYMFYYLKVDTVPKDDKNENVDNMQYDAFFCYSHKDIKWIKEVFWKTDKYQFDLEKEYGFRLMIHNRDWIAGRTIRANVMDGIEKSRRVIFVLSRNFLKSKWGMEEFMIADAEAVDGRKNFIIIILKEKIPKKELTKELKTYLRTHTYIDGTKNKDHIEKRLRFSMPYFPLRQLKPDGLTAMFDAGAFNFDELDSDDEVPQQEQRRIQRADSSSQDDDSNSDDDADEESMLIPNTETVHVHGNYGSVN